MSRHFYTIDQAAHHALEILDIAEDAIISIDSSWNIVLFNHGAEKAFGYKAKEVLGKSINILLPKQYREQHIDKIKQFSVQREKSRPMANRSTVWALHKKGDTFPADVTITKSQIGDSQIFTAILRDITVLKKAEQQLQNINKQLEQKVTKRTQELERTNLSLHEEIRTHKQTQARLEREFQARLTAEKKRSESMQIVEKSSKLASIGVLAAGITHEINQPLNAIKVTVDGVLFRERRNPGSIPSKLHSKLEQISLGASRINEIITHMRAFWNSNQTTKTQIPIQEVVEKSLSLVGQQLQNHNVEFVTCFEEENLCIKGNFIHLEQIMINLIVNAMHALDASGRKNKRLEVIVATQKKQIYIKVRDNGTGFDKETLNQNLFDPFYTNKKSGMGLGLAIVKFFVEKLEGNIQFDNNELGGATFTLQFPRFR